MHPFEAFRTKREKGNEAVLKTDNLTIKRLFSLDKQTYNDGALDKGTKELLGLVASTVLRCNDCIDYHLEQAVKAGYTRAQIDEALGVALLVGGSIVIPHLRHAAESLDFLYSEPSQTTPSRHE
ncbi:MAG: carboxymuconolactone decarboxylase family protein [Gammaproteobacteria bacterium]|nr:MAG: carboxymuconolactone decarboxylase family protein [Gammaproteobacteria bacterium]